MSVIIIKIQYINIVKGLDVGIYNLVYKCIRHYYFVGT